jgi:hypothetical protein
MRIDPAPPRRSFLRLCGAGGAALLLGACGADGPPEGAPRRRGISREDVALLNEALAFEHLEAGFYAQVGGVLQRFAAQEAAHVATLTRLIRDAGGRPVAGGPTSPVPSNPAEIALRLEELRAAAYLDQLSRIASAGLLAVALSIHAVEARQLVALRAATGRVVSPDAALGEPIAFGAALERARELLA